MKDHRPLKILYQAIRDTGYPVTHLELSCGEMSRMATKLEKYLRGNPTLENLRYLDLTFEPIQKIEKVRNRRRLKATLKHLFKLFKVANTLETLILRISHDEDIVDNSGTFIFFALVSHMTSKSTTGNHCLPNIQEFQLNHFPYRPEDLLAFVKLTRSTLKRLQIVDEPMIMDVDDYPLGPDWADRVLEAYRSRDLELLGQIWTEGPARYWMARVHRCRILPSAQKRGGKAHEYEDELYESELNPTPARLSDEDSED